MYIKRLQMLNYRNYKSLNITLGKNVNVFMGDNAQGKTNILEAIYYCAFAKSHRTSKDRELINWNSDSAYVSLLVGKDRLDKNIDINILKDGKKAIKINKIKVSKIGELFGNFNVVMFSPEDLKIIKDSPGVRRKFIDMELCQLNSKYYYNLVQYNKVLNERNVVLKNRKLDSEILDIYDIQLANFGYHIIIERLKYINKLNFYGKDIHKDISSGKENVEFKYISTIKDLEDIENSFYELLRRNRKKDIEKGTTSIGPHRDDFIVLINDVDTKSFGSQGQQRSAVLTIKFSSLKIIKEMTSEYPVLLLDDVLSELDFNRKRYILSTIGEIQTIITCTGIEDLTNYLDNSSRVFKVKEGEILN
ncbi:DNA replication/repair protein RecF [Clostridium tertium]|jgi:DNA replication and repair protein RecF|uniref:DNA replication and repair protein RecF n=2 Tax=Bacillota TaxID=1239 RepID=A0A9X4B0X1_9CLOT|nr:MULTISPECIES: DNA replication/repair protein RecF [Clostridium]MBS5308450.1 DNA replication/repair protein RecF [Clostridium sp.]MBS5886594.1 DNA replication/repair protein RecF [Clostridium sp.]MBS6502767.1 DNA replication/repair protein RecF [Clostridium sp.]MBU6137240.1 DNA replication/repair protein RecF [Clostridium tertium]MDB1924187.1 DNA replication/repair protein RecF [Clostridium tertium]